MGRKYFDILNHLSVTHECDRQTGQARRLGYASLHYVARPKT